MFKKFATNLIFTVSLFLLGAASPVLADQTNSLTGSFSALNQTVNFASQAPANGGDLNGDFTGACTGTIEGNYGGSNHLITGSINGQCNILGFTQPFILNYTGSVDPINKNLTVTEVTHIDGSSSQAATLLGLPQSATVNVTTTEDNLTTGTTYTDPQNSQVSVSFNSLPAPPSGNLSFSQTTPSGSQISQFNIVSPVAYKITSSLASGTFSYNLTLPLPSGFDPNLLIVRFGDSLDDLSGVISNLVFNPDNTISILNLDHFTYFVLSVEVPEPVVNTPTTISSSNQTSYSVSGTATPNTFVNFLFTDSASNFLYTYEPIGSNGLFNLTGVDLSFLTDGLINLEVWVDDNLFHFSDSLFFNFTKDTIAPAVTDDTDSNWHTSPVTIILTCSDNLAGCANTYYTTDGTDPTLVSATGNTITINSDGIYTVKYFSVDNAGNISSVLTALNQVKVDLTAPTGVWIDPVANSARNRTININYTNADNLSGVASATIFYKLNDGLDTFHVLPLAWDTNPLALGNYTLRIIVTDVAGNSANIDEVIDVIAIISNLKAETIGTDKVIVTWDTNHPTTSKVSWIGGASNEDNNLVTHHIMTITGLGASTGYNFESLSRILTGPYSISEEKAGARTFSVAGPPAPTANPVAVAVVVTTPVVTKPAVFKQPAQTSIFEVPTAFAAEENEPAIEGESIEVSPLPIFTPAKEMSETPVANFFRNILNFFQSLLGLLKFW